MRRETSASSEIIIKNENVAPNRMTENFDIKMRDLGLEHRENSRNNDLGLKRPESQTPSPHDAHEQRKQRKDKGLPSSEK